MGNHRGCGVSSVDIDGEIPAAGGGKPYGVAIGWRRRLYRLGAYLGACDRYYRVTLSHARRAVVRDHSRFREFAICSIVGIAIQAAAIAAGFGYFYAAECEHQRIVEQRKQQEQRQRELGRQSHFVRVESADVAKGYWP